MTSRGETPLSEHRRLLATLRHARNRLKLTQHSVAKALDWSPSKLIRIEKGGVGISTTDLKALLEQYQITEPDEVDRLVEMSRASKKSAWWREYRDHAVPAFLRFLELEAATVRLKQFQELLIPGLLQTPEYISELTVIGARDQEYAKKQAEIRIRRQELLDMENGPETSFILDESALYRRVGDNTVMREQLGKLKAMTGHPRASIQIIPFSAGVHQGMKGSFEILELSDEPNDSVLLIEQIFKDQLISLPTEEQTMEFANVFTELQKIALPASDTPNVIDARLKELKKEG